MVPPNLPNARPLHTTAAPNWLAAELRRYCVIEITISSRSHTRIHAWQAKLSLPVMNDFDSQQSQARVDHLIHFFVFWGLPCMVSCRPRQDFAPWGDQRFCPIVAAILAWLVSIARCTRANLFRLCVSSATFGLLHYLRGYLPPRAQYLRVIMLSSAVVVGTWILQLLLDL
jgi:hypothetical protein